MRGRIFFKLLASFALVIAVAVLTIDITATTAWERSLRDHIEVTLRQKTEMFGERVQHNDGDLGKLVADEARLANARATVIRADGVVLADSEADASGMENHAARPEFQRALAGEVGYSTRHSQTVGHDFLYVAAPVPGGAVRLAYPLTAIADARRDIHRTIAWASVLAFLISILLSAAAARIVSRRLRNIVDFAAEIERGNYAARIPVGSGDEIGQVALALDQTGRKLEASFRELSDSRRELETVLNSMQEAVIAVGPDRRVLWANRRMEAMLAGGVRRGQPLVESVRDPNFLAAVEASGAAREVRTARATLISAQKVFSVTAAPMPAGGVVAVLYDLSELERVEKTRRDFIANVSHELRTPLTSVQGYAETLLESTPNGNTREFLEIIRKNASRMTRLTDDLLTLARVESGEHKLNLEPVGAGELLNDAGECFREYQHGEMQLEIRNESRKLVRADRDAVFQVLSNFIDNAIKYASAGGRLELGARDVERGVEFWVRDFGPGIPSEHIGRLFERFYRVDKARSRESGGTGLGLAIAKHIVLAHGGTIRAESEINHGSVFVFSLPEAQREATVDNSRP